MRIAVMNGMQSYDQIHIYFLPRNVSFGEAFSVQKYPCMMTKITKDTENINQIMRHQQPLLRFDQKNVI